MGMLCSSAWRVNFVHLHSAGRPSRWALAHILVIMVALWNRADHYIFAMWFVSSFFFFPRLISAVGDWMSTILPHIVWLSANLGCRSETCCTGRKKIAKNSPSGHHRTNLSGYIFATKAHIDNRKKYLLNSMSQYLEFWPKSGWDALASLGHPANINRGRHRRAAITLGIGPHSTSF